MVKIICWKETGDRRKKSRCWMVCLIQSQEFRGNTKMCTRQIQMYDHQMGDCTNLHIADNGK